MSNKARKLNIRHTYFKQRLNKAHIRPKKAHQQSSWTSSRGHPRNGNRRRPRPRDATPERVAARRAPPLHPPFGGEEAGGAKEGGYGGLRGLGPPWDKKVGFEALARGFACCLHITSKGEPLLIASRCVAVRRGTACCIFRTCSGCGSSPSGVMYFWCLGLAKG